MPAAAIDALSHVVTEPAAENLNPAPAAEKTNKVKLPVAAKFGAYSLDSPTKKEGKGKVAEHSHESFSVLKAWSDALVASDVDAVLALYLDSAVLWPTLSDEIRYRKDMLRPYFEMFVQKVQGDVVRRNQDQLLDLFQQ